MARKTGPADDPSGQVVRSPRKVNQNTLLRRVNIIRYALPLLLFGIVVGFEGWEHVIRPGRFKLDFYLSFEVFFFGIVGPLAVFVVLTYIVYLLKRQFAVTRELEALNLNLEHKVVERTGELAARNEELARANAQLQKLDQLKSDFVSLVSHELRAPLTALNGGLEMTLQQAERLPAASRRILEVMAHESERLTRFVQTILDVSRLDAGKLALNPGPVAVLPLLQRTVAVLFPDARRKIAWQVPPALPPVWADEVYLEESIRNLLANADKYSPPDKPIELGARLAEGCIEITVVDYGPGIAPERQERIFERFQRSERGDRVAAGGWGLGLYFARALTTAQGGELTVRSPAHNSGGAPGTAFMLRLPVTADVPEYA
ncbi:MAG: sensor histidine kinase [Anaerolineales bacterium]